MISFVIPAYNEEALIGSTLSAINHAALAIGCAYEVIVADDASTDRTVDIAKAHGARVVEVNRRQIAATRNAGAREARGDWLIFVDADTLINESVLRAAVEALRRGAVGGGANVTFDSEVPRYAEVLQFAVITALRVTRLAAGCFVFCTREAFEAAGGFDETLFASEEISLSRALKRQGRFVFLRESVTTSGRKVRMYSGTEVLSIFARIMVGGPKSLKKREGLELWYAGRREDVEAAG